MAILRRRTRLLIAEKFQIRYVSVILLLMLVTAVITGCMVYFTSWEMFGEKLAAVYPQSLLFEIFNKVNAVLIFRLLLILPIVVFIGLLLSSRIAGPMYSILRFIRKISGGSYDGVLRVRKGDELKDISDELNNMTSKLRLAREMRREKIRALRSRMVKLEEDISSGEKPEILIEDMKVAREILDRID